jgi:phosphatidylinositol alpha-mannosyltransferase
MARSAKQLSIGMVLDSTLDVEDGVQQYVMTMGEWLRSQGHDVHYLVGQTEKRQLPNIHSFSRNVVVKFNGNRINLPVAADTKKLQDFMVRQHFDVLHVQTPHHPLMAQRIIRAANSDTVIVASFHILPYGRLHGVANKTLRSLLRPSLKRIDQMLAVTPAAARFEKRTFGLDAKVSPDVFDYVRFHAAKPLPKYRDEIKTILYLGRLVPRKGCKVLLEAAHLLHGKSGMPKFRVVVCSDGPMRQQLEAYVREHGLKRVVEFTGFIDDDIKPAYFASADVTVFPSSGGESFGIVLLEAMASGKAAVLAGANPGYASVMEPQPNLLFNPTDAELLAQKIEMLLKDPTQREKYAAWGEVYSKRFDVRVVGKELLRIYSDLSAAKNMR